VTGKQSKNQLDHGTVTFDPLGTSSLSSLMRSWISCLSLGRGLNFSPGLALFLLFLAGSACLSNCSVQMLVQVDKNPLEDIPPNTSVELEKFCASSSTTEDGLIE
jgi:hypothetical protein